MSAHLLPDGSALPSPVLALGKSRKNSPHKSSIKQLSSDTDTSTAPPTMAMKPSLVKESPPPSKPDCAPATTSGSPANFGTLYHEPQHVRSACEKTLNDLGLEQLDLFLIHFPIALEFVPFDEMYPPGWTAEGEAMKPISVSYYDTWRAMEELIDSGLTKRIGVSNIGTTMLREVLAYARVKPAVLQVEMHPLPLPGKPPPFPVRNRTSRSPPSRPSEQTPISPLAWPRNTSVFSPTRSSKKSRRPMANQPLKSPFAGPCNVALSPIPKTQSPDHLREKFRSFRIHSYLRRTQCDLCSRSAQTFQRSRHLRRTSLQHFLPNL